MAKNRNKQRQKLDNQKKKNDGVVSMDLSTETTAKDAPQPMDTSEGKASNPSLGVISGKIKKGVPLKRTKNLRKLKGIARAISINEKAEEKILKSKKKTLRVQSAKSLYD